MSGTGTSPQPHGTLRSTDPGWKPDIDAQPLLAFSGELLVGIAQTHPYWTQADSAGVLANVAMGRKHGRA